MSTSFLHQCLSQGVQFWTEEKNLYYDIPEGLEALSSEIEEHQEEIRTFIGADSKIACCSLGQERMWTHSRYAPDAVFYNLLDFVFRVKGPLNPALVQQSFEELYHRHEGLRTVFREIDGAPVQCIPGKTPLNFLYKDFETIAPAQRESAARAFIYDELMCPFDLEKGPLFKVRLCRIADDCFLMAIPIHHSICDAVTFHLLKTECNTLYSAYAVGDTATLPPLELTYADFAREQRNALASGAFEEGLKYWRKQFSGDLPVLELPTDRPRPAVASSSGERVYFTLPLSLRDRLRSLARLHDASFFSLLLASLNVLCYRYSRQETILIGTASAGRTNKRYENLVGFLLNTLVFRADLSGDPPFVKFLHQMRDTVREAIAHRDVPFEMALEATQTHRDASFRPLHQVTLILSPVNIYDEPFGGQAVAHEPFTPKDVANDLLIIVHELKEHLYISVDYSVALFAASTIERMMGHWRILLESIVENPEAPLSKLNLLDSSERTRLLDAWNQTGAGALKYPCVHEIFEAQAEKTPDKIACVCDGKSISYKELNARANRLGRVLVKRGIGPEVFTGLCLSPSIDMVIAMLATLKAGGGFVPLDPSYPRDRLAFMISGDHLKTVITSSSKKEFFFEIGKDLLYIDTKDTAVDKESEENLGRRADAENLAYLIYTSGSTGRPKGVMVEHRNLANLVAALGQKYEMSSGTRSLLFLSFGFDAFLGELFTALCNGATLYIPRSEAGRPADLAYELTTHQINHVALPAAALPMLPEEPFPHLHSIAVGGEACPGPMAERWAKGRRFINVYGPTECTVTATLYLCPEQSYRVSPPIGKPIANVRTYIVDTHLQPVPIGVPGELLIGGAGVARGYLNQPEQTAESFIPDHFTGTPNARLYRTGDLCRYLPSGDIEFLGRMDQQIKIHGFRIEPGEIESALCRHPLVREAAVLACEDIPDDAFLGAYIVPKPGHSPDVEDLREHLRACIPTFMIPRSFMLIDAMPFTPNGKIDRKALPRPVTAEKDAGNRECVKPGTPLECYLAELWENILGTNHFGIHDNFFDIGGSSLKAAVFTNRLHTALNEYIYITSLYQAPTLSEYAHWLRRRLPAAVRRIFPAEELPESMEKDAGQVGPEEEKRFRDQIAPLSPFHIAGKKNPPAVFLLSPPRSGSTLLRVMLEGHPKLFAPPELMLLSYNTLLERKETLSGPYNFWLEGTIRALMELHEIEADEARQIMAEYESRNLSAREMYGVLQALLGDRLFIDKSPLYCLDTNTLKRAEEYFENARYIHLLRHPLSSIRSFEEARLDETFPHPEGFNRRQLAELVWLTSHRNILELKQSIPEDRWFEVRFEELVKGPRDICEALCGFLEIPFDEAIIDPYSGARMTDGVHPESKMLGDIKFHRHNGIDAKAAERWKETPHILGAPARELAESLGYTIETSTSKENPLSKENTLPATLVPLRAEGTRPPLFLAAPAGGTVFNYFSLAHELGPDQPVYALADPGCVGGKSLKTVEELAALQAEAIQKIWPGPYYIAGWSFGGTISLEIARQLRQSGKSVAMVGLIETWALITPGAVKPSEMFRSFMALTPVLGEIILSFGRVARDLLYLRTAERRAGTKRMTSWPRHLWQAVTKPVFEWLRRSQTAKVISQEDALGAIHEPSIARILWTVFMNVKSMKRYRPTAYPGHIALFRAEQMRALSRAGELGTILESLSQRPPDIRLIPGNHYSILQYPYVRETARQVYAAMEEAEQRSENA